jgi:GT2 family glycosyltransferase
MAMEVIYPIEGRYKLKQPVDVSVIIPIYNSASVVAHQITEWQTSSKYSVEVIYVDDKSADNSLEVIFNQWNSREDKKKHLVKIVRSKSNQGFGRTCNFGAYHSNGQYLIFLNADTVVTPGWIEPIIDLLKDETVGIVGNLQIKDGGELDGTIDSAGSEWCWETCNFMHIGRHSYQGKLLEKPFTPANAPTAMMQLGEREMVTGCCFSIRKELFDRIGGFDLNYKRAYWEDSEICMTVKDLGYKILFEPKSVIYHKLSHTNSSTHIYHDGNKDYFMQKWVNSERIDPLINSPRPIANPKISKILVKRRAANGDVLIAGAVASALQKKYPESQIDFCTECGDVLKNNPYINDVLLPQEVRLNQYHIVFDLNYAYERRPYCNILQAYADVVGVNKEDCNLFFDTAVIEPIDGPYVVIQAARTNWVGRNWHVSKFDDIARRLNRRIFRGTVK